jgi:hypothetical protein
MITDTHADGKLEDRFDVRSVAASWSASHREAADRLLEAYERTVERLADAHVKQARSVDLPAVATIAETQANLSRDVAEAYVRSVRKLLER